MFFNINYPWGSYNEDEVSKKARGKRKIYLIIVVFVIHRWSYVVRQSRKKYSIYNYNPKVTFYSEPTFGC